MTDAQTLSIDEVQDMLAQAQQLSKQGNEEQARTLIKKVLKQDPNNPTVLMMLGGSYFCSQMYQEAELIFERLVLSDTGRGQYSIGLFNTLWKLERVDEALEEMKRFLAVADRDREQQTVNQYLDIVRQLQGGSEEDDL